MWQMGRWFFLGRNWIFLIIVNHLFTYAQGGDDPPLESVVRFTMEPRDVVVGTGGTVTLPCAAPSATLTWRFSASGHPPTRDHTLAFADKYRKQQRNGSLVIESMSSTLTGQYQCVATIDGIGTALSRVATVFLAEVPEVSGGPRSVLAVAGLPALLPCGLHTPPRLALKLLTATGVTERKVYGASRPHASPPTLELNVTWLKNGSPLRLERMERARVSLSASGALEFDPVREHDAATYSCRVSLARDPQHTKSSEPMELRVNSEAVGVVETAPRFIATPQPVTAIEGASITFDCCAVGNPKPEITWLNNGVAIDLSDLDSRFYLSGCGSLRVQSARALDTGGYTCRAHNRLDSTDLPTQLDVMTMPRVHLPDGNVVRAHTRGDVTLRCEVKGRPIPRVSWYKDGDRLSANSREMALLSRTSLRIEGVLPVDAGMFQCAASSPAGVAFASLRLVVLPPEDEIIVSSGNTSISDTLGPIALLNLPNNTMSSASSINIKPTKSIIHDSHDILNSLITADSFGDPTPKEFDFLGETSSAYTLQPQDESPDIHDIELFHAAKGLDLDLTTKGNATIVTAPRNLKAVIVKHRFVTLSWEVPDHTSEDVTGYTVIYKAEGSKRERVSRGGATKHEMNVAPLQPNTTYYFTMIAHTEHAVSPPTESIVVRTPEEEITHGPPRDVTVEVSGPHALRISWRPPTAPISRDVTAAVAPPTKYTVHYTEVENGREQYQWVDVVDPTSETVSTTLGGLRAASIYSVRVSASGGGVSEPVSARTPSDAPAAPPGNVTAVPLSPTSILVRWEAPPSRTHRGSLTGYKLRYRPISSGAGVGVGRRRADSLTTAADARRAELRDLEMRTTYQIRVCALNANGSGPFSEWVTATTQQQERDESSVPGHPPPLTARAGRDWISVWWSEGDGDDAGGSGSVVRGYVLGWGLGIPDEHSHNLPAQLHSHVIRELEPNSEYVISLRASNALGLGPAVYATVRTKPAALDGDDLEDEEPEDEEDLDDEDDDEDEPPALIPPVGLKAIMLNGYTAVVYWTDPTLPKGQTATDGRRYVVRWSPVEGGARARYFNATDLNCMLDDLRPFTTYEFAVKLIKGGRESSWSMLVSNTSLEAAPSSAPRDLRAHPASPAYRTVDLTWSPPLRPNGIITGYVVMYAATGGAGFTAAGSAAAQTLEVKGAVTRTRLDRLRAKTTYSFRIQARNNKGLGPVSQSISYTTGVETGEGAGLAAATSAWLWASAGGACAVLALAAALALSLCCRRHQPLTPDTSTYQKSSASTGIKPPDLWIHHDQMELKHCDKSLHSSASKISAGSVDGPNLATSTLTLGRPPMLSSAGAGSDYEPARHAPPPASLDRRHYVPQYVESRSPSRGGSEDTALLRASPSLLHHAPYKWCERCDCTSMTGVGGMGCSATCDRRQHHRHNDQSRSMMGGLGPLSSPQSLASLQPLQAMQPLHPSCGSNVCQMGVAATCSTPTCGPCGPGSVPLGGSNGLSAGGSDIYASAARERGQYVAYEPLGHFTHRDSLSSDTGPGSSGGTTCAGPLDGRGSGAVGGSLQRRGGGHCAPPMHSFALGSDTGSNHSTPSHGKNSERETSPYKKCASASPGHLPNRLQLGGNVPHCTEELEPLTPSRSTERLNREMQNLEGLMKDLSAITQQQFHC